MPLPFVGRLHLNEYLALVTSFLLVGLELVIRTATLLLPDFVIHFFYRISRNAFNSLSSPNSRRNRNKKKSVSTAVAHAVDFVELCALYGYHVEEHVVQTADGYLLGLHRLAWKKGEEDQSVNAGEGSQQKKVVYLHHGLMMNSEVWVCMTEEQRCLPFTLVEKGFDVWLGNNRGGKYSRKSLHHKPTETAFWDFSMDQFAFFDIPDSINYVLATTHQKSLSYIGFSQGTAQAFAALSIHPALNQKVDVFIALAPAMAPPGLASGIVSSLVKASPEVLFLAFGRKAILGSTTMWQTLLYPGIFVYVLDKSLEFLFGWQTRNIPTHQKLAAYPHLYTFTSTKSVVHWFQIIRNGTFQMFDDEAQNPLQPSQSSKYFKSAQFPTRQIRTPILLVYGGSDSLVDIKLMLAKLPKHTVAKCIPKYEHLDLIWAGDVDKLVFPHVLDALESYAISPESKKEKSSWSAVERNISDRASLNGSLPPGYSEDESSRLRSAALRTPAPRTLTADDFNIDETEDDYDDEATIPETPEPGSRAQFTFPIAASPKMTRRVRSPASEASSQGTVRAETMRRLRSPRLHARDSVRQSDSTTRRPSTPMSSITSTQEGEPKRRGPEGWWSSTGSEEEPDTTSPRLHEAAKASAKLAEQTRTKT